MVGAKSIMPRSAGDAGRRLLQFIVIAGLGLALAACDKCSMPTWQPNQPPATPLSCHSDTPATQ